MGKGERAPTWQMMCWLWKTFADKRDELQTAFRRLYQIFGSINDLNLLNRQLNRFLTVAEGRNDLREWIVTEWIHLLQKVLPAVLAFAKDCAASTVPDEEMSKLQKWMVTEWKGRFQKVRTVVGSALRDCPAASGAGESLKLDDLTGRWAPREKKQDDKMAKVLAHRLFPSGSRFSRRQAYRLIVSTANRMLDTAETHMCHDGAKADCPKEGDWDIDFSKLPGRCLHVHKNAFEKHGEDKWTAYLESLTKPDSKGAKGTSVFITELSRVLRREDDKLAAAQWEDQVKNLKEAAASNGHDLEEFLSNFVCLLDFSGSMEGDPMNLAMALGAFLTPLQGGPFKGKSLTFETSPHWMDINGCASVHEALRLFVRSPWGGSTNFVAAHEMILRVLEQQAAAGASPVDVQKMLPKFFLVVSDMQFDQTGGYCNTMHSGFWETMHTTLTRLYHERGMRIIGEPLELPTMIYWNARGNTSGMPVCKSSKKAFFITGTSTAVVKTFLTRGVDALAELTPWSYLLETLTNPWYLRVLGEVEPPTGEVAFADEDTDDGAAAATTPSATGALAPPAPGCPVLIRQIGTHKYEHALAVLKWVRTLGDEKIRGYPAKDLTVFPAAFFPDSHIPCIHWVELGMDIESPGQFGKSEPFDTENRLHTMLYTLWTWFKGDDSEGFHRYCEQTARQLDFAEAASASGGAAAAGAETASASLGAYAAAAGADW
jgi:hypothetical protein